MSFRRTYPTLTVVILTFNGEDYLERILRALREQKYENRLDTLIVDSGSTDSTLQIIERFPEVRLVQIPNTDFGHGKTRNYAASLADSEIVAYLTHDAVPNSDQWATEIVRPFLLSSDIVAVMGKQTPRPGCFPLLKYEISGVFAGLGGDLGPTIYSLSESDMDNEGLVAAKAFYSDVNSAVRRDFLLNVVPYRDVRYAEDQLFGKDLLEAGYLKAYAPEASVEHSNDLSLDEYGPRIFDETVALREIGRDVSALTWKGRLRLTLRGILADSVRILKDPSFTWKRRVYWLLVNPIFHVRKWQFHNLAARADLTASEGASTHSLEAKKKNRSPATAAPSAGSRRRGSS